MSLFSLENLKKSSIYITPNFPTLITRRYKFSFFVVVGFILIYTLTVAIVVSIIITLSPAREIVLLLESQKLDEQSLRIGELENQVVFLTHELETMASSNRRLKYAIILANTDSLDSTAAIYDSLRKFEESKPPIEGNILAAFRMILNDFFSSSDSTKSNVFMKPVNGIIINEFNESKGHLGVDFAVKQNSPIFASCGGYVVFADFSLKDGFTIIIQHENNYKSFYKHCIALVKKEREYITTGELIALSGNTGYNTTGPHLHFEIWKDGKPINPLSIVIN